MVSDHRRHHWILPRSLITTVSHGKVATCLRCGGRILDYSFVALLLLISLVKDFFPFFYRATLCLSAVRPVYVRLSVCLSLCHIRLKNITRHALLRSKRRDPSAPSCFWVPSAYLHTIWRQTSKVGEVTRAGWAFSRGGTATPLHQPSLHHYANHQPTTIPVWAQNSSLQTRLHMILRPRTIEEWTYLLTYLRTYILPQMRRAVYQRQPSFLLCPRP